MGRRIARARRTSGEVCFGLVDGADAEQRWFTPVVGTLVDRRWEASGPPIPLEQVELLCPVTPSKVVGIGTNYRAHAAEMGRSIPPVPKMFLMPATAVVGPGAAIAVPPGTNRVDHEAELAVVIGRRASRVAVDRALEHVVGFTVANDVTARDFQRADKIFARAKGFDTFCPLGPWVAVDLDPSDLRVQAHVDGILRQDGRTSDLIFDVPTLVSFVSHVMTLLPGDVIATGTPSGVGPICAGQTVRVTVEGIGSMENPVVDREDRLEAGT
jgi:2-keto-4-pentenoate hydratase/2-oxohepta-3-ene-1,7-dioic acid hydratase in catechol pathway